MARFILSINLSPDGVATGADVGEVLMRVASGFITRADQAPVERGVIRTLDGVTVGLYEFEEVPA